VNNIVREKLKEVLTRLGHDIYQNPSTLKGALQDLAGDRKAEINALVLAAEEKIPQELISTDNLPIQMLISRLTRKLQDSYGMTEATARWAVESWALTLGKYTEAEIASLNPVSTPTTPQATNASTSSSNPVRVISPPAPTAPANVSGFIEDLGNGLKIEMVKIPAGSFAMGSPGSGNETPLHRVDVREFYMGKYAVTQAQYQEIAKSNPSHFKGADLPVEEVSWQDAKNFCQYLNIYTGKNYRLPSEAEWEYACRAGSRGLYCFGDEENLLEQYAWYSKNSGATTHAVGQKKPNGYGLYDMHGNVWEWGEDVWHENYNGAPSDGSAWVSGGDNRYRLLRGGGWYDDANVCRAASRDWYDPDDGDYNVGFRLVCVLR